MTEPQIIREITAAQTRPVRQRVLRPHQHPDELVYPGDDADDSFHLGAYQGNEPISTLVAILSMYRAPKPESITPAWRIRGMASIPEARGSGLGRLLVEHAREKVWAIDRAPIWCNARESAFGFYHKLGFEIEGGVFEIEGIGPHAVMVLEPDR
tara:strand:+ start:7934 stop:8395 length:462 start_codon:yes stop_codon:yes gene_type:complete